MRTPILAYGHHFVCVTHSSTPVFLHRTGYQRHVRSYTEPVQSAAAIGLGAEGADGVDLTDQVIVVTGANSGLGKQVATYAAAKGARLYMFCRSMDRAQAAKDEIVQATSSAKVEIVQVDVGELASVRKAVEELLSKESKVDAVVCNAGVLLNDKQLTSEGNEATFSSHLLGGSYLLSQLLRPKLSEKGRVIFVTSGGMYNFKLPAWKYLTSAEDVTYNGVNAYAFAKRGQVLLAGRLAETEPEITWVTAHPGWADTNAMDEAFGDNTKYLAPLREAWEGAEGVAWLLGAKNLENGALYLDRKPQPKHLAGPFFTEGSHTKNTKEEVDEFMANLKKAAGL